jgi:uncharacterized protein YjiS (DUF1127 family)
VTNQLNVVYLDKINFPGLSGFSFRSVFAAVKDYSNKRAAHAAMVNLDDRMLADIGLDRSDILGAVKGTLQAHGKNDR